MEYNEDFEESCIPIALQQKDHARSTRLVMLIKNMTEIIIPSTSVSK